MKWEWEDFLEHYKPVDNKLVDNAAYDGNMFETYNEELDYIRSVNTNKIWTLVTGDFNQLVITPGYHIVNRLGYFLTTIPHDLNSSDIEMDELITMSEAESKCRNFIEDELEIEITDELQDKLNEEFL